MRSRMHLSLEITIPCTLLLLVLLSAHCPSAAVAQGTVPKDAIPTTITSSPANSPNHTAEEVQLMPTIPLQTATANLTRPPTSTTTSSRQQQQQQAAAARVPPGKKLDGSGNCTSAMQDDGCPKCMLPQNTVTAYEYVQI